MSRDAEARALTRPTPAGVALTVFEAATSAIPLIGGPLAVALGTIRETREHRVADFVLDVSRDLQTLADQLDSEYVKSSQFAERLEGVLEQVGQAGQAAKREYYRRALAGLAMHSRPGDDDWQLLMEALNGLQPIHLRVLAKMKRLGETDPKPVIENDLWPRIVEATPELNDLARLRCWDGLATYGILDTRMLIASGQYEATSTGLVTAFGMWFAHFLEIEAT